MLPISHGVIPRPQKTQPGSDSSESLAQPVYLDGRS
jgi:hypothetical protein